MKDFKLENIEHQDIEDVLEKVQTSFNIKFARHELSHIVSFGQLCDHVANKIQLRESDDCTGQQAFYKLREAFSRELNFERTEITLDSSLEQLLPRADRRTRVRQLENSLGFPLNILHPPNWLATTLIIGLLGTLITLFFNWRIGLPGFLLCISVQWLADRFGKELAEQSVGDLVRRICREHYLNSRRDPATFNPDEVEKVLSDLFIAELDLDPSELNRESKF